MNTFLHKNLNPARKDKGFTLIELLVVIVIIGILAAIAIPIFLGQRKKAFEASQKSDARTVATQMESFYTDAQAYPAAGVLTPGLTTEANRLYFGTITATTDYVVLSPNNAVKVFTTSSAPVANGGFCVEVSSANTDKKAVYDSKAGGLQPMTTAGACASGTGGAYPTQIFGATT